MARMMGEEHKYYPGMGLKVLGLVLFVAGLLRYLGLGWDVVLMVLGLVLLLKGFAFKYKKFKK